MSHHRPENRQVKLTSSDGVSIMVQASKLHASPVFQALLHEPYNSDSGFIFDDAWTERAEVINAAINIISHDTDIADVPYQCQVDLILFLTQYQFDDALLSIKASIHLALSRSHTTFHPFTIFRIAVYLNDISLCGRIITEMGSYRWAIKPINPENFGLYVPGAGMLLASALSFQDMQSLPSPVYWALVRSERICMNSPQAYAQEFMRLMKLKDAPALAPA